MIRDLGEQLDAHHTERPDAHDDLTMSALYNVLEKERRNEDPAKPSFRSTSKACPASSRNCTMSWTPPWPAPTARTQGCWRRNSYGSWWISTPSGGRRKQAGLSSCPVERMEKDDGNGRGLNLAPLTASPFTREGTDLGLGEN